MPSKPDPALKVGLRKTQVWIVEVRAELAARPAKNRRKDRQLFAKEKPARPSLTESMTAAQVKPQVGGQTLEAMRFELNGLREPIEIQLGPIVRGQLQHQRPQQANFWRRLQCMGLPTELSKSLLKRVAAMGDTRQTWYMLSTHLLHIVQTPEQNPLDADGVLALVGSAGTGKTTTLTKMATCYVFKYGAQSLALVSMDSYRIGAQEQIKTLGWIPNVLATLVDPDQSPVQALAPLARKRMVLIDTAGLSASDLALCMRLEALASPSLSMKDYLMIATTSQSQVLKSVCRTYRHCGLTGYILTKPDEVGSLGESMALAIVQRLPVAYLVDGPQIPDDLRVARSHQPVSRAVSLQTLEEPSEDAMTELFAGLYQQPTRCAS